MALSIGKNTATHQAYGKIVVTLDCDNYTAYRGGRFVIDQFEENDYNCVVHQFDWNPKKWKLSVELHYKKKFNEIGGYDQSFSYGLSRLGHYQTSRSNRMQICQSNR